MTEQYLVGELSVLLARLQASTADTKVAADVAQLRREAEHRAPGDLVDVELRALSVADGVCWQSLARGDPAAFEQQAAIASQLLEFGVCSGVLPDTSSADP
jgi:hypothetical protein